MSSVSDENLILSCRAGEMSAFTEIFERYTPMIMKLEKKYYLSDGDSDDLIQEGRIGLFKAIEHYDASFGAKFSTYAYSSIQSEMQHAVERSNRLYNLMLNESVPITDIDEETISGTAESPEEIVLSHENFTSFYNKLKKTLSEFENEVLERYIDGYSTKQIASILDKDTKSIANTVSRIRKKAKNLT